MNLRPFLVAALAAGSALFAGLVDAQTAPTKGAAAPAARARPMLSAAGEGRRAFLQYNCYSCHGMYAAGAMGPSIVHAEKGDIREAVAQGESGGMPSFHGLLTSSDVDNLAAYLKSIGTPAEPTFMDWWEAVPSK